MKPNLIIGIGNPVLSDDAVGLHVVQRAQELLADLEEHVDFKENYSAGFDILHEITGYEKILIVDSIMTGKCEPGTCIVYAMDDFAQFKQVTSVNSHSLNLPTIIDTGRKCGYDMPDEFVIFGIEAADVITFSEKLTEKVEACLDDVVSKIRRTMLNWINHNAVPSECV